MLPRLRGGRVGPAALHALPEPALTQAGEADERGTLSVHVDGGEHALDAGDSMYFDSSLPHAYRRSRGPTCAALVVTSG
jgi:hypothetical protein